MLGFLEGKIELKTENMVIVNVNGVGYRVYSTGSVLSRLGKEGEPVKLHIHHYLRENVMNLYGFPTLEELDFFSQLISISGIGPKAALSVMNLAPVETIKQAIASGQKSLLTKVSGIGNKTAERIILELQNKIVVSVAGIKDLASNTQALDALVSLGYTASQAREALKKVPATVKKVEARVKEALRLLGRRGGA